MVKNTPLNSKTMNEYSAISPRRNDQWSGKTFRRNGRLRPARPTRSSSHLVGPEATLKTGPSSFLGVSALTAVSSDTVSAGCAISYRLLKSLRGIMPRVTFKIARTRRDEEAALGDDVALGVNRDRQLRQRTIRWPEDHLSGVPEVEGGLVAGAQQVVGLLLPQADRAADVGADLGVAKNPADIPAFAGRRDCDGVRIHPYDDDRRLGLLNLVLRAFEVLQVRGLAIDQLSDLNTFGLDRLEGHVIHHANARRPDGPLDGLCALLLGWPGAQIGKPDEHRQQDRGQSGKQRASDDLPPGELGLVDDLVQLGQHVVLVVVARCGTVPVIDHLVVVHELAGPVHRADAEKEQRQAKGQSQEEVSGVGPQRAEVEIRVAGN